ncbi:uncharacterized protein LOC100839046 [Brachypodium distachyon]|uniref:uncharacterized protein LOC100839046 n=1 Tax=Brachypodium distachyon TaxID=15368 RepID=UPI00071CCC10|nr:uncharacterized protein LOC100839046 [Brachypodium distachyon]|eukprot:XP_014757538.1 uncharacterized protein LOC100839046 [Brachypodium distachyon]
MEAARAEEIVWHPVRSGISPEPRATQSLRRPPARLRQPRRLARPPASGHRRALPPPPGARPLPPRPPLHPSMARGLRGEPLELHDAQFARLPIPRSHVADAIGNVLDKYLAAGEDEVEHEDVDEDDGGGGEGEDRDDELEDGDDGEGICGAAGRRRVESFRVECTEWLAEHAARWCAALKNGLADEVILFNRGDPPVLSPVPPGLLQCATVTILHLGFFTVEAGELDALTETIHLGLYGCACRPGVVEGVVAACRKLHKLWIHDCAPPLEHVVVSSAIRLWRISMLRTAARSLTVHNAPILHEIVFPAPGAMVSIRRARWLRRLISLHFPTISLEIDREQIPPQPQTEWLATVCQ